MTLTMSSCRSCSITSMSAGVSAASAARKVSLKSPRSSTRLLYAPKDFANSTKFGLSKSVSIVRPSHPFCWDPLIADNAPSFTTIATTLMPYFHGGRHFHGSHQEPAIATETDDGSIGMSDLRADRRRIRMS